MKIIIEIPESELSTIQELQNIYNGQIDIIKSNKFFGNEPIVQLMLELGLYLAPTIVDYLMNRKSTNKKTSLIINGTEFQYETKEQLNEILVHYSKANSSEEE